VQELRELGNHLTVMTHQESNASTNGAKTTSIDWQVVLGQHDGWLRTIVLARVGERDAVDEVMQEVALAAVRQSAPIADVTKVGPWLYQLAVRQSLLYRRKCGRRRKLVHRYVDRLSQDNESLADPLTWLIATERRSLVRMAMDRLAHRDKEVLLLKYAERWSYQQIAEHLGISHSAVEARLHRARQRMRRELAAAELIEVQP
jgi:RNA polymerase sigma-70 factor (ECF subfamily)